MPFDRASGLLLHITSLPSQGGIGDLGPAAYDFANFLHAAGQRIWQVLPLSPVGFGNSPYGALSAMALNPLLASLEVLRDWGWIGAERLSELGGTSGRVDFDAVFATKLPLLREAAEQFLKQKPEQQWAGYEQFCSDEATWLDEYAAFVVLRDLHEQRVWTEWEKPLAYREPDALQAFVSENEHAIAIEKALQFACQEQWTHLHAYCRERGIAMMGDVAIFVSFDSCDVWVEPELFELDEERKPLRVAGVPPDYFSKTGQRWGNPLYRWDVMEKRGFKWWVRRMRRAQALYDMIRLDHFRGFDAYWAIPGEDETAVNGEWVKAPGEALFNKLREELGELPFIAEDLGLITPEVEALRRKFELPGMCVLQFAFGGRGAHIYLPHFYEKNTVVYTGTHDNNTTLGWWQDDADENEHLAVEAYLNPGNDGPVWALVRAASTSVADLCLFPVQDVIGLGGEGRINVPSAAEGNWAWRCDAAVLTAEVAEKLRRIADVTDRTEAAQTEIEKLKAEPSRDVAVKSEA